MTASPRLSYQVGFHPEWSLRRQNLSFGYGFDHTQTLCKTHLNAYCLQPCYTAKAFFFSFSVLYCEHQPSQPATIASATKQSWPCSFCRHIPRDAGNWEGLAVAVEGGGELGRRYILRGTCATDGREKSWKTTGIKCPLSMVQTFFLSLYQVYIRCPLGMAQQRSRCEHCALCAVHDAFTELFYFPTPQTPFATKHEKKRQGGGKEGMI